jgi:hypothetical protein
LNLNPNLGWMYRIPDMLCYRFCYSTKQVDNIFNMCEYYIDTLHGFLVTQHCNVQLYIFYLFVLYFFMSVLTQSWLWMPYNSYIIIVSSSFYVHSACVILHWHFIKEKLLWPRNIEYSKSAFDFFFHFSWVVNSKTNHCLQVWYLKH